MDEYRDILKRNWQELRNKLRPERLLPELFNLGVLDFKDIEDIRKSIKNSREEAVDDLWQILHTKGQTDFEVFKKVLQKVQPELAIRLGECDQMYIFPVIC